MPGIIFIVAVYCLAVGGFSFLKFGAFRYFDYDLAVYAQLLWNMLSGSGYSSLMNVHFLGNHFQPVLFILLPLYAFFRSPLSLLVVQTLALGVSAFAAWGVAKRHLPFQIAFIFTVLYLFYPGLVYTNLFEFHPVVLAVPALMGMLYFFEAGNFAGYFICMVAALSCQENIPLVTATFGILAFVSRRNQPRWYVTAWLTSGIFFIVAMLIVIPLYNQGQVQMTFYGHLGDTLPQVALYVLTHPFETLARMVDTPQKVQYIKNLFLPFGLTGILGIEYVAVSFPLFMQHLLSLRPTEHSLHFHYTAEMIPFIFAASVYGMKRLTRLFSSSRDRLIVSWIVVLFAFPVAFIRGPWLQMIDEVKPLILQQNEPGFERLLAGIPREAPAVATFRFLSHLVNRPALVSFHNIVSGTYPYSKRPFVLSPDIDYALIDSADPLTNGFYDAQSPGRLHEFFREGWGAQDIYGTAVLLRRHVIGKYRLIDVLQESPRPEVPLDLAIGPSIDFMGFSHDIGSQSREIGVTFFWHCRRSVCYEINTYVDFVDTNGTLSARVWYPVCYRFLPTQLWQEGDYVSEYRRLSAPVSLPAGDYEVKMGFCLGELLSPLKVPPAEGKVDSLHRVTICRIGIDTPSAPIKVFR